MLPYFKVHKENGLNISLVDTIVFLCFVLTPDGMDVTSAKKNIQNYHLKRIHYQCHYKTTLDRRIVHY